MRFDHTVKIGGVYYPAGTEIEENTKKKSNGKVQKNSYETDKGGSDNG